MLSFIQVYEIAFLLAIPFFVIGYPIVCHIEYKKLVKKYGKETADEIWKRF